MPTIPVWAMKLIPYAAFAIALGIAVWFIDHQGYKRAQEHDKVEQQQADLMRADMKAAIKQQTRDLENNLQEIVTQEDANLHRRLGQLDITNKTVIQPILEKEIKSNARFTDPDAGLTDGMLDALNQARSGSGGARLSSPVSGNGSTVSGHSSAKGQDNSHPSH